MPTYLVERYWPGVTRELLLEALNRGRRVMEQVSTEGTRVRDIITVLIPEEEVVFSLYDGPSADAVRQINDRAGIRVSRIVEAIWMSGDGVDGLGDRVTLRQRRVCQPRIANTNPGINCRPTIVREIDQATQPEE